MRVGLWGATADTAHVCQCLAQGKPVLLARVLEFGGRPCSLLILRELVRTNGGGEHSRASSEHFGFCCCFRRVVGSTFPPSLTHLPRRSQQCDCTLLFTLHLKRAVVRDAFDACQSPDPRRMHAFPPPDPVPGTRSPGYTARYTQGGVQPTQSSSSSLVVWAQPINCACYIASVSALQLSASSEVPKRHDRFERQCVPC